MIRVLLLHRIRRDRVQLSVWILSTGLLAAFSASAVASTYGDANERAEIVRLAVANPAILILRGLPQGTGLPAFVFFQIFTYIALLAGLMSTFLAVRHTRAEEESGRAELIGSTPAGRTLPTIATLLHGALSNVVLGIAVAAGFVAGGLPVDGSVVTGAAATATGLAFLGVGLVAAQFARSSRAANTMAVAAVGLAFVLRGVGDATGTPSAGGDSMTSAWPSWLSPIGWAQHVGAFTANDLAPLLLCLVLAAGCVVATLFVLSRRDTGASLLPARSGRRTARAWLNGSLALVWRLQWPSVVAWCLGGAAFGLLAGSLSGLVEQATGANPTITRSLETIAGGGGSTTTLLISAMFAIVGVLAACCATQVMVRLRQEETAGTAELLLATPLGRVRWLAHYLAIGVTAVVLVLLSGAVASSAAVLASGDDPSHVGESFAAAAAQLPAVLTVLGTLAVIAVALPAVTVPLGWTLVGVWAFVGIFGGLVGFAQWVRDLSPFTHTPALAAVDLSGAAWLCAVALATASIALALMRRRELRP